MKMTTKNMIRLNKLIAQSGFEARRKAEELILQGRISVNNQIVMEPGRLIDYENDLVLLDGEKIKIQPKVYFLLNKPRGFVSTVSDEKKRPTVTQLIKTNFRIYPVGRLDYSTTGVLILTNDGDFSNLLLRPRNKIPRVYRAFINKPLEEKDKNRLLKGIILDGKKGRFLKIVFHKNKNFRIVDLTAEEGRNHFVKDMFNALGYMVEGLHRLSFAGLNVDDLKPGEYRKLHENEINKIKSVYEKE